MSKPLTLLDAAEFEKLLSKAMHAVVAKARETHLSNAAWTRAQWTQLAKLLRSQSLSPNGDRFWVGYKGAKADFPNDTGVSVGGEWLFGFSLVEYHTNPSGGAALFGELLVAAESEWGTKPGDLEQDFEKLLTTKARFRVFIHDPGKAELVRTRALERIRELWRYVASPTEAPLFVVTWCAGEPFELTRLAAREES